MIFFVFNCLIIVVKTRFRLKCLNCKFFSKSAKMNILRGAVAPGRGGGGREPPKTEKPHAQSKLLHPTEKCKVRFFQVFG